MESLPARRAPHRHLFGVVCVVGFFLNRLLLLLLLILKKKKYNKFIGVLHGLKKLRFSTSNTRSVSGDKTTAAQKPEFHCPFSSHTKRCLFKPCPFPFESQSVSVRMSFIWSYCLPPYLKKLV